MLPFKCPYCGKYFCIEHRLPENHNCPNSPSRLPLGPVQHPGKNPYLLTLPKGKRKTETLPTLTQKKSSSTQKTEVKSASPPLEPYPKRKIPVGKIIGLALVGLLVAVAITNGQTIISTIQDYFSPKPTYMRVKVISGTWKTIEIEGNYYTFYYDSKKAILEVGIGSWPLVQGYYKTFSLWDQTRFEAYGIEIIVSEAYPEYIILHVRSL